MLFDQGANYGDLWYFLPCTRNWPLYLDRAALKSPGTGVAGSRSAPWRPSSLSGHTQPIMILLSEAEILLNRGETADAGHQRRARRLKQARAQGIAIDRDLATWLQITRVRANHSAER